MFKNNTIYKFDDPILVKHHDDQDWAPWLASHLEDEIRQEMDASCATIMREPNYVKKIKFCKAKIHHLQQLVISEDSVLVETKRRWRESMHEGSYHYDQHSDASRRDYSQDDNTVYVLECRVKRINLIRQTK
jgi:hypothetical protein